MKLSWTPATDEGLKGPAKRYEVRFSDRPIVSEDDWKKANRVPFKQSRTDGSQMAAEISGLGFNSTGYVAVKAINLIGIYGPISDSISYATEPVRAVYWNDAQDLKNVTVEGTWNLVQDTSRGKKVFASNSFDSKYKENSNASLTVLPVNVTGGRAILSFDTWTEIEKGFDYGYVEVSKDGGKWQVLDKLTGVSGWANKTYDLSSFIGGATTVQVRFRLTSDYSVNAAGWRIDRIAMYAPNALIN